MAAAVHIEPATGDADVVDVRALFEAYQASLGVDLCFQGFDRELAGLPGDYAPPSGRLLLARDGEGRPAGCIALRGLDTETCEMKRLYVTSEHRGRGLGRALAEAVMVEARAIGYRRMCLDTLPQMTEAAALYASLGFREVEPYTVNPVGGARFLGLEL
jgi:putative acetyltransferase